MLFYAVALFLIVALSRGRRDSTNARLFLEVLARTLGTILLVWVCWALSWWVEQRW
jgi:hypothetical protein